MTKFKEGDRVRVRLDYKGRNTYKAGDVFTIRSLDAGAASVVSDSGRLDAVALSNLELITDYQPITPKVGEKYRVLKDKIPHWTGSFHEVEGIYIVREIETKSTAINMTALNGKNRRFHKELAFTTEYLELVEEPERKHIEVPDGYFADIPIYVTNDKDFKPFDHDALMKRLIEHTAHNYIKKQSVITKTMNFIKKLTQSAEDKTLEKADFINSCGDLTSIGKEALLSLVFQEKKKELVALAEQVIEENKD